MATLYVNGSTGNNARDGLAEIDLNAVIAGRGPKASIYNGTTGAIDVAAAGDTIRIARGTYTAPTGGIQVKKSLYIRGEQGTVINPFGASANEPCIVIDPNGVLLDRVEISDLSLQNTNRPAAFTSGNYGLKIKVNVAGSKLTRLYLNNVSVNNMGDSGFYLVAAGTSDEVVVFCRMDRCWSTSNWGFGLEAGYVQPFTIDDSYFLLNSKDGAYCDNCEARFSSCAFENNERDSSRDATFAAQCRLHACLIARVDSCHFENFNLEFPAISNGATVSGTGIPGGTTVSGAVSAGAKQLTLSANATASGYSTLTIGGTAFSNCLITAGSPTVYYGQFNQHALNIENCPAATVLECMFINPSESTDVTQRGIYLDYIGTGNLHSLIGPQRMSFVKTAIQVANATNDVDVYLPFIGSGTGTVTLR
jgi:hypothetical protein